MRNSNNILAVTDAALEYLFLLKDLRKLYRKELARSLKILNNKPVTREILIYPSLGFLDYYHKDMGAICLSRGFQKVFQDNIGFNLRLVDVKSKKVVGACLVGLGYRKKQLAGIIMYGINPQNSLLINLPVAEILKLYLKIRYSYEFMAKKLKVPVYAATKYLELSNRDQITNCCRGVDLRHHNILYPLTVFEKYTRVIYGDLVKLIDPDDPNTFKAKRLLEKLERKQVT
ncbi:MAG: hypothetical protein N2Z22_06165 [Turneriella sp.]|nr:hypothetical protein [Turneriella sp.]